MARPRVALATCAEFARLAPDDEHLAVALEQRGIEAVPVVWNGDAVEWGDFAGCLIRSVWDYHLQLEEFLRWTLEVEAVTPVWNRPALLSWNARKQYLKEVSTWGVPLIPTRWLDQGAGADALEVALEGDGWDDVVVKPVVDLGARNLMRVRRGDERGRSGLEEMTLRGATMVQPFLSAIEDEGEVSIVHIAGERTHAVRKRAAAGDFRVQELWGGRVEPADPSASDLELAELVVSRLDPAPAYARVDLVTGPDGSRCLIELELIEPNLYFSIRPEAAERLADWVGRRL